MSSVVHAAFFTALALFVSVPAFAAPCGAPDFLDAFPPDGESDVPTNATLSAHYAPTATYDGEDVSIEHTGVGTDSLEGTFDAAEGLLSVTVPEAFVAGDEYVVKWPRLRGAGSTARGRGVTVSFTAGNVEDVEPPTFDGLDSIQWDVRREHDDCTNSLEDRFAFDLGVGRASDDGGRDLLALVVYQTEGPQISERDPPVEVLTAPIPAKGSTVRVERALGDATGRTCFAALVRDLTSAPSGGTDREVCTTTVAPPFFYGCAVSRRGRVSHTAAWAAACAALLFWRRRASSVP